MIAKVIAHGADRGEAIARMRRALGEFVIEGVENNIDFQLEILEEEEYRSGKFDTGFIQRMLDKRMTS